MNPGEMRRAMRTGTGATKFVKEGNEIKIQTEVEAMTMDQAKAMIQDLIASRARIIASQAKSIENMDKQIAELEALTK